MATSARVIKPTIPQRSASNRRPTRSSVAASGGVAESLGAASFSGPFGARVGTFDNSLEREADTIADQVMRTPAPGSRAIADASRSPSGEQATPHHRAAGGTPLPADTRAFMERRFGQDFGAVRVHSDQRAAELSANLNARAFTHENDLFFATGEFAPQTNAGRRLLAHELAHTLQQREMDSAWIQRAPPKGLLSASQVKRAVAYTKGRYDIMSQRAIQQLVRQQLVNLDDPLQSVEPDGDFGARTAQAVAAVQQRHQLAVDGMVGPETLDALIRSREQWPSDIPDVWIRDQLIHLTADYYELPVSQALAVHFTTQDEPQKTEFQAGVSVVLIGEAAFADSKTLAAAIRAGLEERPSPGTFGPRPTILTRAQEQIALQHDKAVLQDPRAVRIVQHVVGSEPDGLLGSDTVQRIAAWQASKSLTASGKLELPEIEALYVELRDRQPPAYDAIVRLLIDYFDIDAQGVLDVSVVADTGRAAGGVAYAKPDERSNSHVWLREATVADSAKTAAINIVHEFEHAWRSLRVPHEGDLVEEFYARSQELVHHGVAALLNAGEYIRAAGGVVERFEAMTTAQKAAALPRLERVSVGLCQQNPQLDPLAPPQEYVDEVKAKFAQYTGPCP